jgi:hypothetical protein
MPSFLEPGETRRARAAVQLLLCRFRRTAFANAPTRGRRHAERLVTVAVALGVSASSAQATPARIGVDHVRTTAAGVAVTWHAAVSGRYRFWIGGSYCGNGVEGARGRYLATRPRTVVLGARRVLRPGADIRVCLRTSAGTLSDAVRLPPAPARIGIDHATMTAAGVAVRWHAAVSGRYRFWIGGSYCGNGVEGARGRYLAPRTRTVVLGARRVLRPGADVRLCLRTSAGTLSDAVRLPPAAGVDGSLEVPADDRSAFYSALALAVAVFALAWIAPFLWKRRRARR